mgnify:FL=1|tara:strand:+ start:53 stop:292 length:240 start_codon:yes stop_codon:yes gene_type:complete
MVNGKTMWIILEIEQENYFKTEKTSIRNALHSEAFDTYSEAIAKKDALTTLNNGKNNENRSIEYKVQQVIFADRLNKVA